MLPLSAHDLLRVWETGEVQHPVDRALTILAAAFPEHTRDELAGLSVGRRDARLLDLHELTWGPNLDVFVECPRCAERLEFEVTVDDLRVAGPDTREDELVVDGLTLRFRLPDSRDLAALLGCRDPAEARGLLTRRCILQARRGGTPVSAEELPEEAVAGLARRMSECDPQAEVLLDLRCPVCAHDWQTLFDIVSFLWAELTAQARRLLRETDTLARAYGWREAEILDMSPRRRRSYLEMVT